MAKFSVIIPSCHFSWIKKCIDAIIANTDFSKTDMEVVVCFNGAEQEAKAYMDALPEHFRYLWYEKRIGACTALNRAAEMATGEYIIKLDDDLILLDWASRSRWVDKMYAPFVEQEKVGVSGPLIHWHPRYNRMVADGCIFMTPKKLWDQLGGADEEFNPGMGDDSDYSFKVEDLGYKLVCVDGPCEYTGQFFSTKFPLWHASNVDYGMSRKELQDKNTLLLDKRYGKAYKPLRILPYNVPPYSPVASRDLPNV